MGYVQVASLASSLVSVSLCSFVFFFDVVTGLQKSDSDLFSLFSLLWVKMCHECCFKSYLISFHFSVICEWKCVISAVSSLTYCIYIREFSNFKILPLYLRGLQCPLVYCKPIFIRSDFISQLTADKLVRDD